MYIVHLANEVAILIHNVFIQNFLCPKYTIIYQSILFILCSLEQFQYCFVPVWC